MATFDRCFRSFLLGVFFSACFVATLNAQSSVTNLGDGAILTDIGFDSNNDELVLVGSELEAGIDVAKVFRLPADRSTVSSDTLVGLGAGTVVNGISSDGSRAAGFSESPASIGQEGISWRLDVPDSPQAVGYVPGNSRTSVAFGAWADGVVGDHGGALNGMTWTEDEGILVLPDAGAISTAFGVNIDGSFVVGFTSSFGGIAGAAYWDNSGINQLEDPFGNNSIARAVSPNSEFIGGDFVFLDPATFTAGTQAAVWSGDGYHLTQLTWADGSRVLGRVNDVSSTGYAVGETVDGRGFIWHESFQGAEVFDDWLLATAGLTLDSPSQSVVGIAEEQSGELHFAVNGSAAIVSDVSVSILGDVNLDSVVNFLDIGPFISVLSGGGFQVEADIDRNGFVNFLDIAPFIAILSGQ